MIEHFLLFMHLYLACGISVTSFLHWQRSSGCQLPRIVSLHPLTDLHFSPVPLTLIIRASHVQIPTSVVALRLKNLNTIPILDNFG